MHAVRNRSARLAGWSRDLNDRFGSNAAVPATRPHRRHPYLPQHAAHGAPQQICDHSAPGRSPQRPQGEHKRYDGARRRTSAGIGRRHWSMPWARPSGPPAWRGSPARSAAPACTPPFVRAHRRKQPCSNRRSRFRSTSSFPRSLPRPPGRGRQSSPAPGTAGIAERPGSPGQAW